MESSEVLPDPYTYTYRVIDEQGYVEVVHFGSAALIERAKREKVFPFPIVDQITDEHAEKFVERMLESDGIDNGISVSGVRSWPDWPADWPQDGPYNTLEQDALLAIDELIVQAMKPYLKEAFKRAASKVLGVPIAEADHA